MFNLSSESVMKAIHNQTGAPYVSILIKLADNGYLLNEIKHGLLMKYMITADLVNNLTFVYTLMEVIVANSQSIVKIRKKIIGYQNEDSIFYIDFQEFISYFDILQICYVQDDYRCKAVEVSSTNYEGKYFKVTMYYKAWSLLFFSFTT